MSYFIDNKCYMSHLRLYFPLTFIYKLKYRQACGAFVRTTDNTLTLTGLATEVRLLPVASATAQTRV